MNHCGIPITLAIVYEAICRRVGLLVKFVRRRYLPHSLLSLNFTFFLQIGMPRHIVVQYLPGKDELDLDERAQFQRIFIDVFGGATVYTNETIAQFMSSLGNSFILIGFVEPLHLSDVFQVWPTLKIFWCP